MLLEEYDVQYEHIKGTDNVVAGWVSRHPTEDDESTHLLQFHALAYLKRNESLDINHEPTAFDCTSPYIIDRDIYEEEFPMAPELIGNREGKTQKT